MRAIFAGTTRISRTPTVSPFGTVGTRSVGARTSTWYFDGSSDVAVREKTFFRSPSIADRSGRSASRTRTSLPLSREMNEWTCYPSSRMARLPLPAVHPVTIWRASITRALVSAIQTSSSSSVRFTRSSLIAAVPTRHPAASPGQE